MTFRLEMLYFPGAIFTWTGKVIKKYIERDLHLLDIEYTASVTAGIHRVGTATLALPTREGGV